MHKGRLRLWQVKVSQDSAADTVHARLVVVTESAGLCQTHLQSLADSAKHSVVTDQY